MACDAASAPSVWPPWLRWLWQLPPWRRPALAPRLRTLATVAAAAGWAKRRPRGQACPSLTAPSVWPGAAQRAGGPPAARQARRRRRGRRVRGLRRAEQPRALPLTPRPAPRDSRASGGDGAGRVEDEARHETGLARYSLRAGVTARESRAVEGARTVSTTRKYRLLYRINPRSVATRPTRAAQS